MSNNSINFDPATMNPAAIILPNVETFINNYLDYIIILLILIIIGFIIIKKHLL